MLLPIQVQYDLSGTEPTLSKVLESFQVLGLGVFDGDGLGKTLI